MSQQKSNFNSPKTSKKKSLLGLMLDSHKAGDSADKSNDEKRKKASKKRTSSKNTCDFIAYDAMYKDGIVQVEDGLFSQTIEFSDISYQSARKETQESIFSALTSLYNYFNADTSIQLTIANTPLPETEIGTREFFELSDPRTADLAEEYNQILNDKMREGVSNLERHRYITYTVGADNVDSAIPKLTRIRTDVMDSLSTIRCDSHSLDGEEYLKLINSMTRPQRTFEFNWDKLSQYHNTRTKDFISPLYMNFAPENRIDCFELDGVFCSVLCIRDFGSILEDNYLASVIDLPMPLVVTLHIQPIAQSDALALVKRQLDWMDKEIIDEQMAAVKKGYDYMILPPELRYSKEEAEELLDFLRNKNERLFVYTGLIYTYASTLEELDYQIEQITRVSQGNSLGVVPLYYRQKQAFNSMLPFARNHVNVSRHLTTGQIAMQMPFASQELNQEGGGYYGQSKSSGNLVICNRKLLNSPMGFVCGKPGSGKSFSVKREITNTILAYPHDEVFIFDPAGEYSNLVEATYGTNIKLAPDSKTYINPFDLPEMDPEVTLQQQIGFKVDAFMALSTAMLSEGNENLCEFDRSIISRCVQRAYDECEPGCVPTLGDFYNLLKIQKEPDAQMLALRYERFVSGALSFFNHQSNVSFDSRITNIDLHELSSNMKVFGMLTVLEAVRDRMFHNFHRGVTTWLYIDEIQSLFSHPAVIEYLTKFWNEGRKFNLISTGITQNSTSMLQEQTARTIVLNSDFIILHKQSPFDRKSWCDLLSLSRTESGYIDDLTRAGEGLLICGGVHVPIRDDFPHGRLYDLFNTKPEEVAELKRKAAFEQARKDINVTF